MKIILLILLVVLGDYLSKLLVVEKMAQGQSIPLVEGVFHLTYIQNAGAAFGLFAEQRLFFILVAAMMLGLFVYYFKAILQQPLFFQLGCALMVGGAIGNLIDRITIGKVIDFLDFRIWPIFNVADIAICVGAGFILWDIIVEQKKALPTRAD